MIFSELPKFEAYEEASQIRRSMKSVRSNIVEAMAFVDTKMTSFAF
ncbi:MAG: four helix bundle protein [Lentimonas sp.]